MPTEEVGTATDMPTAAPQAALDGLVGALARLGLQPEADDATDGQGGGSAEVGAEELLPAEEPGTANLDRLLESPDLMFDFRAGDAYLLERLCTPEAVRRLLQLVTTPPPDTDTNIVNGPPTADDDGARRRPYIAAELLADDRLLDVFLTPAGLSGGLLGVLFGFLDTDAAAVTPVLAGYFCGIAAPLLLRHPAKVAEYLRSSGPERLLRRFLHFIDLRCCADLLLLIVCSQAPDRIIFPVSAVARGLVGCIVGATGPLSRGELDHAVLLLDTVLARACAGELCNGQELLCEVASKEVVEVLIKQALDKRPEGAAAAAAATSALASAVCHVHLLPQDPNLGARPASPLALGPRSPLSASAWDRGGELELPPPDMLEGVVDVGDGEGITLPPSPMSSRGAAGAEQLEAAGTSLVAELCPRLAELCERLPALGKDPRSGAEPGGGAVEEAVRILLHLQADDGWSGDHVQLATRLSMLRDSCAELRDVLDARGCLLPSDGRPTPELIAEVRKVAQRRRQEAATRQAGRSAVEVAQLVALLVRTGRAVVFETLLSAAILQQCLAALMSGAWSSMLHNALYAVLSEVISNQTQGKQALLSLLQDSRLMGLVVHHRQLQAQAREEGPGEAAHYAARVGFMGHLHRLCVELQELGNQVPEVGAELVMIEGWSDAVEPEVSATETVQQEPLGGPPPREPEGFDCLAAMNSTMDDEVDLTMEDLRDVNEELDTQQLLDMASSGLAGRRAKVAAQKAATEEGSASELSEDTDAQHLNLSEPVAEVA